jgi:ferredoxin-nitrate reductase
MLGELVCTCNQVGDANIVAAVESGCSSLEEVCAASRAGIGCGSCKPEILRIMESLLVKAV